MFDDPLKLIWFPASVSLDLAVHLVEIQCQELNTPLFSEQELSRAAYYDDFQVQEPPPFSASSKLVFACGVLLIGQDE